MSRLVVRLVRYFLLLSLMFLYSMYPASAATIDAHDFFVWYLYSEPRFDSTPLIFIIHTNETFTMAI